MIIKNVRLGHATNSSSSHSIVIMNKSKHDYKSEWVEDQEFGWNEFQLVDTEDKLAYLAQIIKSALEQSDMDEEYIPIIIKDLIGVDVNMMGHIDHQSNVLLPGTHEYPKSPNRDFIKDFKQFMERKDVVVFGGNDNSYEDSGEKYAKDIKEEFKYTGGYGWYADPGDVLSKKNGDWWTIYNRKTGAKMEFSFEAEPGEVPKPHAPDLIDLKLTNYCPFDCEYCYMDSNSQGKHSSYHHVYSLATEMGEVGVFEVALGGGEPTLHPDFFKFLEIFKNQGVTPNFTTANTEWLKDPDKVGTVLACCGSFAFSPKDDKDLDEFTKQYNHHMKDRAKYSFKPVIHVVIGTVTEYQLREIFKKASAHYTANSFGVTLLGFKDVGRGLEYKPHMKQASEYLEWLPKLLKEIAEERTFHRIGIDTCLAKELEEVMELPSILYYTKEGFRSMYIDAVENIYAASSYSADTKEIHPGHVVRYPGSDHRSYDIKEMFVNIEAE